MPFGSLVADFHQITPKTIFLAPVIVGCSSWHEIRLDKT